jgi:hypothetical protein
MKKIIKFLGLLLLIGLIVISISVEREADYKLETLGGDGKARALVLYHPSRDAHFSDDLSMSFSEGLISSGFSVERATITEDTPVEPNGYMLIAVVSNTYYWTPDLPTLHYLDRARLDGIPVIGIIGGAGATGRSERLLREALARTGADVLHTQSYWLFRPNDESRMDEANRAVALERARQLGEKYGEMVLMDKTKTK